VHVREVGLQAADDEVVWTHAQMQDLIIADVRTGIAISSQSS
jgi:hypothetical protein